MRSHVKTIIAAAAIVAAFATLGVLAIFHMLPGEAMREEAKRRRETRYVAVCADMVIHGIRKDGGVLRVGEDQIYLGDECSLLPESVYKGAK